MNFPASTHRLILFDLDVIVLYPDAHKALERLYRAGYRLGVLSGKPRDFTVELLERLALSGLVTVVVGEAAAAGQDAVVCAGTICDAIGQGGCTAADSWIVSGRFSDLEAGRQAGLRRCLCVYGGGSGPADQADLVIHRLSEFADHPSVAPPVSRPGVPSRSWGTWLLGAATAACILTVLATMWAVRWVPIPVLPEFAGVGWKIPTSDFFSLFKLRCLLVGGGVAAGLTLLWLIARGRQNGDLPPAKAGAPLLLAGVLLAALSTSTALSAHPQIAVWGFPNHGEGFAAAIGYLVLFGVAWTLARKTAVVFWLVGGVLAGAAGVGLLALLQTMGWDPLMSEWGRQWIAGAGREHVADTLRYRGGQMLVCGTLGNSNYFGSLAALAVPLALGLVFDPGRGRVFRWSAGGLAVLLVTALIGSQSRAGLVGLAAGLALLGWLWYRGRGGRWLRRWWLAGAGIACLAVGLLGAVDLLRGFPLLTRLAGGHMSGVADQASAIYRIEEDGTLFLESPRGTVRIEAAADDFIFLDGAGRELHNRTQLSSQRRPGNIPIILEPKPANWTLGWVPTTDGLVLQAKESTGVLYFFLVESDGFHPVTPGGGKNRFVRIPPMMPAAVAPSQAWWLRLGSSRGYIWVKSWPLLSSCWLRGYGLDTFPLVFPQNDQAGKLASFGSPDIGVNKPHNLYLGLALGAGLPALFAFLGLAGLGILRAARRVTATPLAAGLAAGLAGYLVTGLFNDGVIGVAPAFWVCLGVACAAVAWPVRHQQ